MPEQQQSGQDTSMDFLWTIAIVIGIILLVWYFGRAQISTAVLYVRYYEIKFLDFAIYPFAKLLQMVGFTLPQLNFSQWVTYIQGALGSKMNFSDLITVSTFVGSYMRYPLCLIIFGLAGILHFTGVSHRFRNIYSAKSLKEAEQVNWPQITPVVDLDLVKTQLDEGPWAIGLSPMSYCKKHDLVDIEERAGKYKVTLRRGMTHRNLSLQIGPRWSGVEHLPVHLKALFAIFAARINSDKKSADVLLDKIAESAKNTDSIDFSGYEELLKKYAGSKKVAKIVARHSYITTVMASVLVGAREAGVIAVSEFIWLKPIDRRMWYMLNSVGRSTAISEICGAFAHWLAEKKLGLPLSTPMVEEAVNGLEVALSEMIYKPEEEE